MDLVLNLQFTLPLAYDSNLSVRRPPSVQSNQDLFSLAKVLYVSVEVGRGSPQSLSLSSKTPSKMFVLACFICANQLADPCIGSVVPSNVQKKLLLLVFCEVDGERQRELL